MVIQINVHGYKYQKYELLNIDNIVLENKAINLYAENAVNNYIVEYAAKLDLGTTRCVPIDVPFGPVGRNCRKSHEALRTRQLFSAPFTYLK